MFTDFPAPVGIQANQSAVLFQEFQRAIFRSQLLDETAHIRRIPARIHLIPCAQPLFHIDSSPPAVLRRILAHRARQRLFRLLGQLIECHISDEGKSHRRIHSRVDWNQIRDRLSGCLLVVKHFHKYVPEMSLAAAALLGCYSDQIIELPEASTQLHRIRIVLHHRNQKSIILFHQNLVILRLILIIILDKTLRIFRETHMPEMLRLVLILRIQIRQHTSRRRIGDLLRPVIALAAV